MKLVTSRIFLIAASFTAGIIMSACATNLAIKIYILRSELGGVVRDSGKEIISFAQADGMYCMTRNDTMAIAEAYKSCMKLCQ